MQLNEATPAGAVAIRAPQILDLQSKRAEFFYGN